MHLDLSMTIMNPRLFKAGVSFLRELSSLRDLDQIQDYFDYLSDCFSLDDAIAIVNEAARLIYRKDRELHNWLVEAIDSHLTPITLDIYDLEHILLDEGYSKKDFINHPTDNTRLLITPNVYEYLKTEYPLELIHELTEVSSHV